MRYKEEVAELRKVIEEYESRGTPVSNSPSKVEIAKLREENAIVCLFQNVQSTLTLF